MKVYSFPTPDHRAGLRDRRFQAFVVGLPKTGTTSLAKLFRDYAKAHEFLFAEAVEQVCAWQEGSISAAALGAFLLHRDRVGNLEMDAASFNHFYLELLPRYFPDACYIATLRESRAWVNSYLNMMVRWRNQPRPPAAWQVRYGKLQFRHFDPDLFLAPERVLDHLPMILDDFFAFWGAANRRLLAHAPRDRTLLLRTHELSSSIDALAGFLRIPAGTLQAEAAHAHQGKNMVDYIGHAGEVAVSALIERHCLDVMTAVFPEFLSPPGAASAS